MAKKSSIEKNERRKALAQKFSNRRAALKAQVYNREAPAEDRFQAVLKLAQLPRNGARIRVRNRCELTGRPRGYYRKFRMSRIAFRDLSSMGMIPGVTKASW
ncbi:MAG: 30S ribosomal protein S14 [Alphaproteobacteria bacterium]|jgi:small subunit ribosomal protein S14|nr:30S ribosomal protein S14 [Alphaproteobacteria bacterium]